MAALVLSMLPAVACGAGCGGADGATAPGGGAQAGTGGYSTGAGDAAGEGGGAAPSSAASNGGGAEEGGAGGVRLVDAPLKVVRIIAIGDTGEGNLAQHQVADRMSDKCLEVGGCHAVMMNGDNFYNHGVVDTSDAQWGPKFEQPYDRPGLNGLPFYAVLGNHDHGPSSNGVRQAQIDYSLLPRGDGPGTRMTDKWHMPAAYYDVRVGHVHLFGIDTVDFTSDEQALDMSARVAASDARWKIVFGHHPRYTSGAHAADNQQFGLDGMFDMQRAIYCRADMYMSGHDHNLELIDKGRDERCPGTYFAVSGAGSKIRRAAASAPREPGQLFYTDGTEGFAYLESEGRTLRFEFIDKQGAVLYAKTIAK
ncbi:metallophosphoesterase [Sorangium sp. So ce590]|uniref:metallophosphoesterase n=1 Tax=Sorangium sp. So ce590 TaxID=3133317 RepID=UPI003F62E792